MQMKRLTMSLDDNLADAYEAIVRKRGYRTLRHRQCD
jgi:metal-responsive CopG/Arc/MetJ family transcriptional regulator